MKILLTGSSGFIGNYLARALAGAGHHVVGLDRDEPGWHRPRDFVHADILERGALDAALDGVECVYHLAASKDDWGVSREGYFRDNAEATRKLIRVGSERGVSRWFHYSTVGVLPRGPEPLDESAAQDPDTDYGASKARAEELFAQYAERRPDASVTVLRPSAVFGPRNPPSTNVHRLVEAIRAGRFVMVGDGRTPKTTSYIENLVAATLFLHERMEAGLRVFHYVDDPVLTTEDIVDAIHRALGRRRPAWRVPPGLARPLARVSDAAAALFGVDLPITAARIEKFCTATNFRADAIRELGYRQEVDNETAIVKTVDWHLRRDGG